jgi:hypothetical protein
MKKILSIISLIILSNAASAYAQAIQNTTAVTNASTTSTQTFGGYALNPQFFFDNKVSVLVPSSFFPAETALINQRFGNGANAPKIVLTDKTSRPLIALNFAPNTGDRESIIHFYRDMKNDMREQFPTARFLKTDVIRNRTLAIIEVILPDKDGKNIYNMMAFRYVDYNFFFFNFSCPEEDMAMWQNSAREMAENIKVVVEQ